MPIHGCIASHNVSQLTTATFKLYCHLPVGFLCWLFLMMPELPKATRSGLGKCWTEYSPRLDPTCWKSPYTKAGAWGGRRMRVGKPQLPLRAQRCSAAPGLFLCSHSLGLKARGCTVCRSSQQPGENRDQATCAFITFHVDGRNMEQVTPGGQALEPGSVITEGPADMPCLSSLQHVPEQTRQRSNTIAGTNYLWCPDLPFATELELVVTEWRAVKQSKHCQVCMPNKAALDMKSLFEVNPARVNARRRRIPAHGKVE